MSDALARAVESVVGAWDDLRADATGAGEVASQLDLLLTAVRAERDGSAVPDLVASPLARRLLARLRAAYLVSPDAPEEALATLRAIEAIDLRLAPAWSERFQDRLEGPGGLELVVEIAHDLRSPLTSILFLAETMLNGRSGPLTPLQQRQMGLVYAAAFGLNAVASDVIELVRGGHRQVDQAPKPFAVSEILESVRDIVRPIAEEKELTLEVHGLSHDHRLGHPAALNRVLLNLTTNALKFTSTGGVEVRLEELDDPAQVRCSVTDTGRGIPASAMALLYEPFRRRQQVGDYAFSGSGLGLSICRTLVEAMGSTLEVDTTDGVGTRFAFVLSLPRATPAEWFE